MPITERCPVCRQPIGSCRCGQDDDKKRRVSLALLAIVAVLTLVGCREVAQPDEFPPIQPAPVTQPSREDPRFDTCAEANKAGYGSYVRGADAEYGWYRDSNNDGKVC